MQHHPGARIELPQPPDGGRDLAVVDPRTQYDDRLGRPVEPGKHTSRTVRRNAEIEAVTASQD